ncbi:sugar porter family MFS transporter [Gilvimarinus chinensis]|uniref:sugar porter family MFS transporter n=1 Tax=Gilvimarinus chinensis TaxID=396005 RepID=UPI000364A2FB|nr:sugar porter family MFS transporter [Gilvimarinus chinensis]
MTSYQFAAVRYAAIVAFGGFIFGLDAALISGVVRDVTEVFDLSAFQVGLVVGSPGYGVLFALLMAGYFADKLGRKKTLQIIASLYVISAVTSAIAPTYETLVAARFLGGLAFTSLSLASMYIGEIAPPKARGKLVAMNQMAIVVGLSAAYLSVFGVHWLSEQETGWVSSLKIDSETWRWMLGVEIVPALLWVLLLFSIPESPRWLVLRGRNEEAKQVLAKLLPPEQCEEELQAICDSSHHGHQDRTVWHQLQDLFSPAIRKALIIAVVIAFFQQTVGINAVMFYAPIIFEQVGLGTNAALFNGVYIGLISVVATALALALIDRLGRRILIIVGLVVAGVSLLSCAWAFSNATYTLSAEALASLAEYLDVSGLQGLLGVTFDSDLSFKAALAEHLGPKLARDNEAVLFQYAATMNSTVILLGVLAFIAAFQFSIGPVMWVLFSELFPIHVRSIAIPAMALVASIVSAMVQQLFPIQLEVMGSSGVFLSYGVSAVLALVLLAWLMPETKGKTIEEIETMLASSKEQIVDNKQ